jgi:hypothetical protein
MQRVQQSGNVQSNMPMDSPLLAESRIRRDPGVTPAAYMREAFDITYAVHRMGEEGQRRGAGGRGFLNDLNEADEEDDDERELETTRRKYGAGVTKIIETATSEQSTIPRLGRSRS